MHTSFSLNFLSRFSFQPILLLRKPQNSEFKWLSPNKIPVKWQRNDLSCSDLTSEFMSLKLHNRHDQWRKDIEIKQSPRHRENGQNLLINWIWKVKEKKNVWYIIFWLRKPVFTETSVFLWQFVYFWIANVLRFIVLIWWIAFYFLCLTSKSLWIMIKFYFFLCKL